MPIDLDLRISLDYLPCLKTMAVAEDDANRRYVAATMQNNPGALGLQVGCSRRSTRRTAKAGREHYFNKIISGHGMRYEESRTQAKQISDKLTKGLLQY